MIAELLTHYGADVTRVRDHGWRPIRCPFHDDRQASASVSIEKDAFVCHGCRVKGGAIKIIMEREGLDRIEAARWAESVLGASVEGLPRATDEPRSQGRSRWRTQLFD